jgi:hypothetical protein
MRRAILNLSQENLLAKLVKLRNDWGTSIYQQESVVIT